MLRSRITAKDGSSAAPRPSAAKRRLSTLGKGDVTAERILDAAFRSIAAHGCGAVTLRGIAAEAGVALSQLGYYYGNKNSLFAAVTQYMWERYIAILEERLQNVTVLEDQILAFVDHNETILRNEPDMYRNYLELSTFAMTSGDFQDKIAKYTAEVVVVMERHTALHHAKKKVSGVFSVAELVRYILSATIGIALQHFLSPRNREVLKGFDAVRATVGRR
jgi:AcrR family transcriptional regulator